MPVRLNITMDEDVYRRLKRELPPKKISAFIEDAVRARLYPDQTALDTAYEAARKERWRSELSSETSGAKVFGSIPRNLSPQPPRKGERE
jgi:post-segregation antitoxin (ccd killing protein)